MQISVRWVLPVRSISRFRKIRSTIQGRIFRRPGIGYLIEGDFQFVERVGAGLVDAGMLAGGADEQAGKKIGKGRMVLPEADQAAQQIGTAEERAVRGSRAADDDVIASAGSGVAAVEHEFFGAEPRHARQIVQLGGVFHQFLARIRRVDVHFDDAGVGGHFDYRRCAGRMAACSLRWLPASARKAAVSSMAAIRSR